jgi:hypothetical protein
MAVCANPRHDDEKRTHYDARGIFLFYACPACYDGQAYKYRADVFTDPYYWTIEPVDED